MSMELCSNGDLIDFILTYGAIQDDKLLRHLKLQICKGLEALHTTTNHAHLDMKPDNILIGDDYQLKLTDFGFAHPLTEEITKCFGTQGY